MNPTVTLFLLALLLSGAGVMAQDRIVITDNDLVGGETYNWTSNNDYVLDGLVFLEAGATLNIEAGTVIRGLGGPDVTTGDNTSALIISQGAQIFARGTAEQPIIFTASDDDVTDPFDYDIIDRGEWGGLIILGSATIARPGGSDGIEGIDAAESRARFGGTNDADNSGVLNYVSIRHGGAQLSTDNEINGLTLGGVGSGTEIDYIEVFANLDDGIEWFGGTVQVNHAAVSFCGDDGFDYDFGWRGGGQYWFALQGPGDPTGRSGEHDGASPDEQQPFSRPTIYNATYIGIGAEQTASGGDAGRSLPLSVLFRDNAGGYYYNSVFVDFNGAAVAIEDRTDSETDSYARLQSGDLGFFNNYFFSFGAGDTPADLFLAIDQNEAIVPASSANVAATFVANGNIIADPVLNSLDARNADGGNVDPRVYAFGPAAIDAPVAIAGYDTTEFYGAFAPGAYADSNNSWLTGWTALDHYMVTGDFTNGVGQVADAGFLLDAPVPNPATQIATIGFALPRPAQVTLTVMDLYGRPVLRTANRYDAGDQTQRIDVSQLPNGNYLIVLDAAGSRLLQKMVVAH
ncbi:T9SS type A sorting domain-containing protein [Neolewinella litorea]|nr:T9SS type A sorting domain-containing protein [Neolewinella litorea]